MRADLLVFTTREATDRLQYSNLIVDFVSRHARSSAPSVTSETPPTGETPPAQKP
jgi:hypothetical protein